VLACILTVLSGACRRRPAANDATGISSAVIDAHGGRDRIAALGNVRIVLTARFREQIGLRGTLHWAGLQRWSVDAAGDGGRMQFGFDGDRCWRADRHLLRTCSDDDRQNYSFYGDVVAARLAHGFDAARFVAEPGTTLDGSPAPALRSGATVYVFHPETFLVAEVRRGDAVQSLGDYRSVGGVRVAARRSLTIAGQPDIDESWDEIIPGGANEDGLRGPAPQTNGTTVTWVDPARWVAWTETDSIGAGTADVVRSLEQFAQGHGERVSFAEDLLVTAMHDTAAPPEQQRWQVAITLEPRDAAVPVVDGAIHIERWAEQRIAGLFVAGDPAAAMERVGTLQAWMNDQHVVAIPGAHWQVLRSRESLVGFTDRTLALIRIAIAP